MEIILSCWCSTNKKCNRNSEASIKIRKSFQRKPICHRSTLPPEPPNKVCNTFKPLWKLLRAFKAERTWKAKKESTEKWNKCNLGCSCSLKAWANSKIQAPRFFHKAAEKTGESLKSGSWEAWRHLSSLKVEWKRQLGGSKAEQNTARKDRKLAFRAQRRTEDDVSRHYM